MNKYIFTGLLLTGMISAPAVIVLQNTPDAQGASQTALTVPDSSRYDNATDLLQNAVGGEAIQAAVYHLQGN